MAAKKDTNAQEPTAVSSHKAALAQAAQAANLAQVAQQSAVAAEQAAIAAIGREARRRKLDESKHPATTNPDGSPRAGGRYKVGGRYVTADGTHHHDQRSDEEIAAEENAVEADTEAEEEGE